MPYAHVKPDEDDFTISLLRSNGNMMLNQVILECFLTGLYTCLIIATAYAARIYLGKSVKRSIIFGIVVLQYVLQVIHFALKWSHILRGFIYHGDTVESLLRFMFYPKFWYLVLSGTVSSVNIILADCVLIWRCWSVWNRDWLVVLIPSVLTVVETALFCYAVYCDLRLSPLENGDVGALRIAFLDKVASATSYSISLFVTTLTTSLVVFRIFSIARVSGMVRHRATIEIVVESAVLYSISLLMCVISATTNRAWTGIVASFVTPMAGIAPTLIVARVYFGFATPSHSLETETTSTRSGFRWKKVSRVETIKEVEHEDSIHDPIETIDITATNAQINAGVHGHRPTSDINVETR